MVEQNKGAYQKDTFTTLIAIMAIAMIFMPFLTTFNDTLTRLVMKMEWYSYIQNIVVPQEAKMVSVVLSVFGLRSNLAGNYLAVYRETTPFLVEIAWNCVGWQSLLFFIISTIVGFQGFQYTAYSKFKALFVGFIGTILVNILRITAVVLSAFTFGEFTAKIIHEYGSMITIIIWLFIYWWFSYNYILDERDPNSTQSSKQPVRLHS